MKTLLLILWIVFPVVNGIYDAVKKVKPNYLARFCVRGLLSIVHMVIVLPHPKYRCSYQCMSWWEPIIPYAPIFIFQVTSYWLWFELTYNIIAEKPSLLYFDQKENDSGWIDNFFAKFPYLHTPAKIAAFILMILSYYVTTSNNELLLSF